MRERYYMENIKEIVEYIKRKYDCEQVVIINYQYNDTDNGDYYEVEFYLIF